VVEARVRSASEPGAAPMDRGWARVAARAARSGGPRVPPSATHLPAL